MKKALFGFFLLATSLCEVTYGQLCCPPYCQIPPCAIDPPCCSTQATDMKCDANSDCSEAGDEKVTANEDGSTATDQYSATLTEYNMWKITHGSNSGIEGDLATAYTLIYTTAPSSMSAGDSARTTGQSYLMEGWFYYTSGLWQSAYVQYYKAAWNFTKSWQMYAQADAAYYDAMVFIRDAGQYMVDHP